MGKRASEFELDGMLLQMFHLFRQRMIVPCSGERKWLVLRESRSGIHGWGRGG